MCTQKELRSGTRASRAARESPSRVRGLSKPLVAPLRSLWSDMGIGGALGCTPAGSSGSVDSALGGDGPRNEMCPNTGPVRAGDDLFGDLSGDDHWLTGD